MCVKNNATKVQKEVKITRSQTRGPEGSQSLSAQVGVASPKAGCCSSEQLSSQAIRPQPRTVSCHVEPTLPPRAHSEDGGRHNDEALRPFGGAAVGVAVMLSRAAQGASGGHLR